MQDVPEILDLHFWVYLCFLLPIRRIVSVFCYFSHKSLSFDKPRWTETRVKVFNSVVGLLLLSNTAAPLFSWWMQQIISNQVTLSPIKNPFSPAWLSNFDNMFGRVSVAYFLTPTAWKIGSALEISRSPKTGNRKLHLEIVKSSCSRSLNVFNFVMCLIWIIDFNKMELVVSTFVNGVITKLSTIIVSTTFSDLNLFFFVLFI